MGIPQKAIAKVIPQKQAFDNNFLVNEDNILTWVSGESIQVKDSDASIQIVEITQNNNSLKI